MAVYNRGIMSNSEWRSPMGRLIAAVYFLVLTITAVFVIFPFLFSFTAGFKTSLEVFKPGFHLLPEKWNWKNYIDAWQRFKMVRMFINTAVAAGGGVLLQIVV